MVTASSSNEEALIKGLILVVVKDAGPELVSNLSPVPDENALITALHLVSLAGMEEEAKDEDDSKMLGPLPVKSSSEYKSLFYSNYFKAASDIEDSRLQMHGAKVGVILLFDADKLPSIRRAAGLIEPYLELYLQKIDDTNDLTQDFAVKLRDHIVDIVAKPRLRAFWMDEEGIYEYKDPNYVKQTDDVMILDEHEKRIYVLTQKATSVFSTRVMVNKVNELNFSLYQGGYQVVTLESFQDIESLLIKHNIKVI